MHLRPQLQDARMFQSTDKLDSNIYLNGHSKTTRAGEASVQNGKQQRTLTSFQNPSYDVSILYGLNEDTKL